MKRYIVAAAECLIPEQMMNPRLNITGKECTYIMDILSKSRRWEYIPNRR